MWDLLLVSLAVVLPVSILMIYYLLDQSSDAISVSYILPKELLNATLIREEMPLKAFMWGRTIIGRLDELYQLPDGDCVILDTKVRERNQIYRSDIAEISLYRILLLENDFRMKPYGYIRIVNSQGEEYYVRHKLFTPSWGRDLIIRASELIR